MKLNKLKLSCAGRSGQHMRQPINIPEIQGSFHGFDH